jgi:glycosyltransferase involved in cell wall biosynthesis
LKIVYLVERPTQFEAPFFRYAARDPRHQLRVLFTAANPAEPVFDPELGHAVDWGIDLLGGYPWAVVPRRGRFRWLAQELCRPRCDLLITNGYTRSDYLLAAVLARSEGIASALRLDGVFWGPWSSSPGHLWRRRLLYAQGLRQLYDLFLGTGSLSLEFLKACGVPEERQGLFPYAVDVEHFRAGSRIAGQREATRSRLGLRPEQRAVLAIAKLNPREEPRDLIEALPALPAEVRLWIAGDGPARAELERLAESRCPGRATFLGYVPYGELPALYGAADLFVHATRDERWGVSIAEALAGGLPVVASTRVGAAYDLLQPGENGWRYELGDAAELAHLVGRALALDPRAVEAASREKLARWDYAASWRYLLAAAARIAPGSG